MSEKRGLFDDWDWEDTFVSLVFGIIAGAFALLFTYAIVDKNIDCYYSSQLGDSTLYKLRAKINWSEDPTVFKTSDLSEFMLFQESLIICGGLNE